MNTILKVLMFLIAIMVIYLLFSKFMKFYGGASAYCNNEDAIYRDKIYDSLSKYLEKEPEIKRRDIVGSSNIFNVPDDFDYVRLSKPIDLFLKDLYHEVVREIPEKDLTVKDYDEFLNLVALIINGESFVNKTLHLKFGQKVKEEQREDDRFFISSANVKKLYYRLLELNKDSIEVFLRGFVSIGLVTLYEAVKGNDGKMGGEITTNCLSLSVILFYRNFTKHSSDFDVRGYSREKVQTTLKDYIPKKNYLITATNFVAHEIFDDVDTAKAKMNKINEYMKLLETPLDPDTIKLLELLKIVPYEQKYIDMIITSFSDFVIGLDILLFNLKEEGRQQLMSAMSKLRYTRGDTRGDTRDDTRDDINNIIDIIKATSKLHYQKEDNIDDRTLNFINTKVILTVFEQTDDPILYRRFLNHISLMLTKNNISTNTNLTLDNIIKLKQQYIEIAKAEAEATVRQQQISDRRLAEAEARKAEADARKAEAEAKVMDWTEDFIKKLNESSTNNSNLKTIYKIVTEKDFGYPSNEKFNSKEDKQEIIIKMIREKLLEKTLPELLTLMDNPKMTKKIKK